MSTKVLVSSLQTRCSVFVNRTNRIDQLGTPRLIHSRVCGNKKICSRILWIPMKVAEPVRWEYCFQAGGSEALNLSWRKFPGRPGVVVPSFRCIRGVRPRSRDFKQRRAPARRYVCRRLETRSHLRINELDAQVPFQSVFPWPAIYGITRAFLRNARHSELAPGISENNQRDKTREQWGFFETRRRHERNAAARQWNESLKKGTNSCCVHLDVEFIVTIITMLWSNYSYNWLVLNRCSAKL